MTDFKISHVSRQIEADKPRQVECQISAVALAQMAEAVAGITPGSPARLTGFLAKKSRMSLQLVLHVNKIDLI